MEELRSLVSSDVVKGGSQPKEKVVPIECPRVKNQIAGTSMLYILPVDEVYR